jgi:hypothetical protein
MGVISPDNKIVAKFVQKEPKKRLDGVRTTPLLTVFVSATYIIICDTDTNNSHLLNLLINYCLI